VKSAKKQEPSSTGKVSAKTGAALLPFAKCKNKVDGDDNVSKLLLDSDYGGDDAPKKGKGKRVKDSPISFAAKHSKKGVDQSVNHAHGVLPVVDVAEVIHFFNLPWKNYLSRYIRRPVFVNYSSASSVTVFLIFSVLFF
jgi:hypothetical protein